MKDAQSKCRMTDKPSRPLPLKTYNCHHCFQSSILTRTSKEDMMTGWKENWPEISCWGHSVQVSTDRAPWEEETPGWHGLSNTQICFFSGLVKHLVLEFTCTSMFVCVCIYIYVCVYIFWLCIVIQWVSEVITYRTPVFQTKTYVCLCTFHNVKEKRFYQTKYITIPSKQFKNQRLC